MGEARHMGTVPAEVLSPTPQQRPQLGLCAGREGGRLGAQTLSNEPLFQGPATSDVHSAVGARF